VLVVDASVLADALLDDGTAGDQARNELAADDRWAAPNHIFVEIMSVIRGRLLGQKVTLERADDAVAALDELTIDKIDPAQLVARMWELRGNITAYEAAYVATAELLGCPLLTRDRRLARSQGVRCVTRVVHDA
jgi:predicted nucleic acid-binding protein